jgi:tetratricopeptide (TPR) repeat protein
MENIMIDADTAYDKGNFDLALDLYSREMHRNPANIKAQEQTARCLWVLKRYANAISACKEILVLAPNNVMAHVIMAESYYDLQDVRSSLDEIQLAYSMDTNNIEVLSSYGTLLLFEKKLKDAEHMFEKVIQQNKDAYAVYKNLAVIYTAKRNRSKVLFCAKEIYRLRPTFKNRLRLIGAYLDYTRISNLVLVSLVILIFASLILQIWNIFIPTLLLFISFIILRQYLKA